MKEELGVIAILAVSVALGVAGSYAVVALAKAFMMAVAMGNM